jgi:hypothetical protein
MPVTPMLSVLTGRACTGLWSVSSPQEILAYGLGGDAEVDEDHSQLARMAELADSTLLAWRKVSS